MYIQCYTMYIQCIYNVYTVLYSVYTVYIHCITLYIHCIYNVYTLLYNVYTVLYSVYTVYIQCYTMYIQCIYSVIQCIYSVIQCYTVLYNVYTVLYSVYTMYILPIVKCAHYNALYHLRIIADTHAWRMSVCLSSYRSVRLPTYMLISLASDIHYHIASAIYRWPLVDTTSATSSSLHLLAPLSRPLPLHLPLPLLPVAVVLRNGSIAHVTEVTSSLLIHHIT